MNIYKRIVQKADAAAIFIGFAFRDGYINSILSDLVQEITKFVVNKDDSHYLTLTFLNGCARIPRKGLREESVADCIQSLRLLKLNGILDVSFPR